MQYIITLPEAVRGQHLKRLTEAGIVVTPITATKVQRPDMAQSLIDAFSGIVDGAMQKADEVVQHMPNEAKDSVRRIAQAQALKFALCQFAQGVMDAGHSKH